MGNALDAYKEHNGRFPEMVVFYRDGVGESQTNFITETEIPAIQATFTDRYGAGSEPKFTEILVNKRIDDRFFLNHTHNPEPGTMIYSDVVSDNFEFLLIPHKVTVGTVTPTKYFVVTDNTGMSLDQFGQLTYNQCYNFANWQGAVRFPGVCFYAHKIAYLCGQNDLKPSERLQKYLYFL